MILSDVSIREIRPVEPFEERTVFNGMTYGCGPSGYDIRIREPVILRAGEAVLASTIERFNMPANVIGIVHDKSTWARRFIACQNTVIESSWRGYLTLELSNHGTEMVIIEPGSPIAQVVFHWIDRVPSQTYNGKYQDQAAGPQPAIFEKD